MNIKQWLTKTRKYKFQWGRFLFYTVMTITETQEGIVSTIPDSNLHYVLLDYDDVLYREVEREALNMVEEYKLQNVVIMSDKENSYRLFSPTPVTWNKLLTIMLSSQYLDLLFFKWAVIRGHATIRLSKKKNRQGIKVVNIINSTNGYIPHMDNFNFVEYDIDRGS